MGRCNHHIGSEELAGGVKVETPPAPSGRHFGPPALLTQPASTLDEEGNSSREREGELLQGKEEGKLFKQETIDHSYPFDERTDTPLIYRAIEAWYVKVADMRDDLVAQNDAVGWFFTSKSIDSLRGRSTF